MKRLGGFALTMAAAMAGFRCLPGLAAAWQRAFALPLLQALHRVSAAIPFPVLEPLALLLGAFCLNRRLRAAALAFVVGMYALAWYPGYFAAPVAPYEAPGDLEELCEDLTDALNASALAFESPCESAGAVAGMPWARAKPARYPEWMRGLGIGGLFAPWTGEALVDADAPPGYLPFTCVHELIHLQGVADEGAANIGAWRACMRRGGMYADSARLWALRYALARLDAPARGRALERMSDDLRSVMTFGAPDRPSLCARLLGIAEPTRDYDALLGYIAAQNEPERGGPP